MADDTNRSASDGTSPDREGRPPCPCHVSPQPWTSRDALFSPASFIGGLVIVAVAVAIVLGTDRQPIGMTMLAVVALLMVVAGAIQVRRGHRGWCLVRRAAWFGIALPGAPVRVIAALP